MLTNVLSAVLVLVILALVGAAILAVAAKFLAVKTDERVEKVSACLPGANCGGCGYAGCADYAEAIVKSDAPLDKCVAGGFEAQKNIAAALGRDAGEAQAPKKAVVGCQGSADRRGFRFRYEGISTCAAANMLHSGPTDCRYGCLGYGDCTRACKFDAIHVTDGVAKVDPDKCTGCGMCAEACPDQIIKVVPENEAPMVFCANHDRGVVTRKNCSIGCIGCGKCVRICPQGAISLQDNLAVVDMTRCVGCHACVQQCPVHAITLPKHSAAYSEAK